MDVTATANGGASAFRHRRSPSSDRFLGLPGASSSSAAANGVELDEDDVFWTGAATSPRRPPPTPPPPSASIRGGVGLRRMESFGILAALPEDEVADGGGVDGIPRPFLQRKPSISASPSFRIAIPSATKPPTPVPAGGISHCQSAPVSVPMMDRRRRGFEVDVYSEEEEEEEMLPPHEIVARGYSHRSPMTTFSVLEGAGRTLKGMDLRRVRNAIFRQTGFLD
ncbi:hypothetical protein QJS04_geneDACA008539 [Acorus gramineus]|uniref:Senescence regulator n=1 Tax=Acorus gramineus TaxID=55184 RepID=A0AAV9AFW6_ACOGR|nr:hypothetical protein QJS04_geneDACA008539 [Acorus gramineus]